MMGVDLFVQIRVRPVGGANLATKEAGLVYRIPGANDPITANGYYFTKWGNGDEEWHVPVHLRTGTQGVITFNAWYQDGKGHTYYDDNNGELHAATWTNGYAVVQHNWPLTSLKLTAEGVTGSLVEQIADLDWDKQIELVWTVDDWRTVNRYGSGSGQNRWRWIQDQGIDYEQWQIDVKIPGSFSRFQYAVVYRHGTVNNASRYEFWDANGGNNWVLTR